MPAGQLNPYNDATRSIIERISGIRTPEQIVREFFGIETADTINPQILREKSVWWNDKLARLGLDEDKFLTTMQAMFPQVPKKTFESPLIDKMKEKDGLWIKKKRCRKE